MSFSTCDLCDANEALLGNGKLAVLPPLFRSYGKKARVSGPARTVKVFEDNVLVRKALEQPGDGSILVVDGGGSLRCALLGGNLAALAQTNGWSGVVVNGCVRDVEEIERCDVGVWALAAHPQRSIRKGAGETDEGLLIGGIAIRSGDWIYADRDGILVSAEKLD